MYTPIKFTEMKMKRLEVGKRQSDIAFETHILPCRLSLIETGKIRPRKDELKKLWKAIPGLRETNFGKDI